MNPALDELRKQIIALLDKDTGLKWEYKSAAESERKIDHFRASVEPMPEDIKDIAGIDGLMKTELAFIRLQKGTVKLIAIEDNKENLRILNDLVRIDNAKGKSVQSAEGAGPNVPPSPPYGVVFNKGRYTF